MATALKHSGACWTCRLRHKRCDGARPICGACAALEISCHNGHARPEWMDNGGSQSGMAQRLQKEVRQSAKRRRAIALMGNIAKVASGSGQESTQLRHPLPPSHSPSSRPADPGPVPAERCPSGSPRHESRPSGMETGIITAYMDYVFPVLFPFYRPCILDGGRSWFLTLALHDDSFFNAVASLSSYFFSVIPVHLDRAHVSCTTEAWEGLRNQSTQALAAMQRDLQALRAGGSDRPLSRLLASVVQFLGLEVNVTASSGWRMHLDAAISLFEQLGAYQASHDAEPNLQKETMIFSDPPSPQNPRWLDAEQGASRFYSSVLVVADILGSTALGQAPRLYGYHGGLRNGRSTRSHVSISLENVTGCASKILLLIGDVAALDAWKRARSNDGASVSEDVEAELLHRASLVENERQAFLGQMSSSSPLQNNRDPGQGDASPLLLEAILEQSSCTFGPHPVSSSSCAQITRIWSIAARLYLLTIVLGWQPANLDIRNNVSQGVELLREVESPCWLRSLVWPFCVIGCLASGNERPAVRSAVEKMGVIRNLGVVRQVSSIMENVWGRDIADGDSWDIAACLGSLGHPALLL